jgi:hypothetical protein
MRTTAFIALALALSLGSAHAAKSEGPQDAKPDGGDKPRSAQANRMKTCSADAKAKGVKGPDRKAFMSECLKKKDKG